MSGPSFRVSGVWFQGYIIRVDTSSPAGPYDTELAEFPLVWATYRAFRVCSAKGPRTQMIGF